MPARPPCLLKNCQSANPAALAIAFTRRAIWDSDSTNTLTSPATPAGLIASRALHGGGGDGHHGALGLDVGLGANDGDAAAAVVPALHVAPGER